ncbi:MAG: peptidylprolyl isomerase [Desulfobacterales bacterium]
MRLCFQRVNLLIIAAVVTCLLAGPVWAGKAASSDKKIASVNGKAILKSEIERRLSVYKMRAAHKGRQLNDADLLTVKNRILENLIDTELLYQQSQKQGVKVDDKAINKKIDQIKKRFPDEKAYKTTMERMHVSEKEFRSDIERALAIDRLFDADVRHKITVTEKDSQKYYNQNLNLFKQPEQVKISQIWIKVKPDAKESEKNQARKKIEMVQEKINKGEDFGKLAKAYSEGPNAQHEGAFGYFRRGQMAKPIEDAAFALKVGEVSKIVETKFGYHLIKVMDKKPAGTASYKDVRPMIEQHLKNEKEKTEIQGYIEKLKKSANIKKFY